MLLYETYAEDGPQIDDPQNPGVYSQHYAVTSYTYDLALHAVVGPTVSSQTYVGGYAGAPTNPYLQAYVLAGTVLVDRYTVPADPNAPGYDPAAVGLDRRVYHDEPTNPGGVRYDDQVLCDLELVAVQPYSPLGTGGTGRLVASWTTSSTDPVQGTAVGAVTRTVADLGAAGGEITGLPPGPYTLTLTLPAPIGCAVSRQVTVPAVTVAGCTDEYATNYAPAATLSDPATCTYAVRWRSAWGPGRMPVRVAALPGQVAAYSTALLYIGFRPGHPLAAQRPLSDPLELQATVGPDGFATFRLGPYLRAQLGTPDGAGGYRLDLNSPSAHDADLFVGYELRRHTGELLEHGYALNAAVPDEQLILNQALSPFQPAVPVWPGFDNYTVGNLTSADFGRFAGIGLGPANDYDHTALSCPTNPVPVAWLAPGGGFGYWVFQGRPQLGDDVGEGSSYQEPESGARRWSSRGDARRTITASSGVFKGAALMDGLRTLWRSPQVWYMPDVGSGVWVPVTIEPGTFPAGRLGSARQQVNISFTEAAPQYVQGQ